jgi:hypothetical protein
VIGGTLKDHKFWIGVAVGFIVLPYAVKFLKPSASGQAA